MSIVTVNTDSLESIADAIRSKESTSAQIPFTEFASRILNLPSGGIEGITLGTFEVEEDTIETTTITHGYDDYPFIVGFCGFPKSGTFYAGSTIGGVCVYPSAENPTGLYGMGIGLRNNAGIQSNTAYRSISCDNQTTFTVNRLREDAMVFRKDYKYLWFATQELVLPVSLFTSFMGEGVDDE